MWNVEESEADTGHISFLYHKLHNKTKKVDCDSNSVDGLISGRKLVADIVAYLTNYSIVIIDQLY